MLYVDSLPLGKELSYPSSSDPCVPLAANYPKVARSTSSFPQLQNETYH